MIRHFFQDEMQSQNTLSRLSITEKKKKSVRKVLFTSKFIILCISSRAWGAPGEHAPP